MHKNWQCNLSYTVTITHSTKLLKLAEQIKNSSKVSLTLDKIIKSLFRGPPIGPPRKNQSWHLLGLKAFLRYSCWYFVNAQVRRFT